MSRGNVPTDADVLIAAMERCRESRGEPVVGFKHEGEAEGVAIGPAWISAPDGEDFTPLATTHWEADEEGPAGSAPAWFGLNEVRDYAERIGAQVEEW